MALELKKETNLGVPAVYWRVVGITVDASGKRFAAQVVGYLDAEARKSNKQPLVSVNVGNHQPPGPNKKESISPAEMVKYYESVIACEKGIIVGIYEWIKSQPDWAGSADV